MTKAEAMKKAAELLPCHTRCEEDGGAHSKFCPACYREDAIATLLAIDETAEKRGYAKGVEAAATFV